MPYALSLGLVLAILWWLLSGYFQPLLLAFGVASVIVSVVVAKRLDLLDEEGHPIDITARVVLYWPWLLWQILLSNIAIAKFIASGRPVEAVVFRVKARQRGAMGQVIFANSITLTPGTVSLNVHDGYIDVHALTAEGAADLMDRADGSPSEMNRRCAEIEEKSPNRPRVQP